jgi:hypothetical protein
MFFPTFLYFITTSSYFLSRHFSHTHLSLSSLFFTTFPISSFLFWYCPVFWPHLIDVFRSCCFSDSDCCETRSQADVCWVQNNGCACPRVQAQNQLFQQIKVAKKARGDGDGKANNMKLWFSGLIPSLTLTPFVCFFIQIFFRISPICAAPFRFSFLYYTSLCNHRMLIYIWVLTRRDQIWLS